jgi:hypothetical protein
MWRIVMARDLLPTVLGEPESLWAPHVVERFGLPWATYWGILR